MAKPLLAIHVRAGSFSDAWLRFCDERNVQVRKVDCYASNIMDQVEGSRGLMWHWAHYDHRAKLFARQLILSLECARTLVFPDSRTSWHYDDKVGQKYLLEALGAPVVQSHVFYDRDRARHWVQQTEFPKVFKTRVGAGSQNVRLVRDADHAQKLIDTAFGRGFSPTSRYAIFKEHLWRFRRDGIGGGALGVGKGIARLVVPTATERHGQREKGYIYFQDFIPNNNCDIRVIVIGERAFAIKRMVRRDDFRASGSGIIVYDPEEIPESCVRTAFEWAKKLGTQCIAFDFVLENDRPLIVELSYSFDSKAYRPCPGYWDSSLAWHSQQFIPEYFMVEDFLRALGLPETAG